MVIASSMQVYAKKYKKKDCICHFCVRDIKAKFFFWFPRGQISPHLFSTT